MPGPASIFGLVTFGQCNQLDNAHHYYFCTLPKERSSDSVNPLFIAGLQHITLHIKHEPWDQLI